MFWLKKKDSDKLKSFIKNSSKIKINNEDRDRLINMIRPTIGAKTQALVDDDIIIGNSKIGGLPDLPAEFKWPFHKETPMLFCAQYNLAELSLYDEADLLPDEGFFYVFLASSDSPEEFRGMQIPFKFIYSRNTKVNRTEYPAGINKDQIIKTAAIKYFELLTIPHWQNYKFLEFEEKYNDFYSSIVGPIESFMTEKLKYELDNFHQVLGHDRSIQSSVVYEFAAMELGLYLAESSVYRARWNDILEHSKTYELLLQIDCEDENTDLSKIGDTGAFYFGLSKKDLVNHNFDNIQMSFQST